MDKSKRLSLKSKRLFLKSKKSFRRTLSPIQSGDRIDYKNISLLSRFISKRGQILSRRVNRLTLKQQRLITIAIKQARILCLLPLRSNEKKNFEKSKKSKKSNSTTRTTRTVLKKKKK